MIDVLDGWYPLFCIKHVCKSLCTWYYIYVFVKLIVYKLKMKKLIYIYIYICVFAGRRGVCGDFPIARQAAETDGITGIKGNADGFGKKKCVLP